MKSAHQIVGLTSLEEYTVNFTQIQSTVCAASECTNIEDLLYGRYDVDVSCIVDISEILPASICTAVGSASTCSI
jgi:hypothetical protein